MSKLVKARKDPTVVLQLVDEALHQMPLAIPMAVILSLLFRSRMRWDHRFCSALNHPFNQLLPSIAPISDHPLEAQSCQQGWRVRTVVALTCCQEQAQRIAQPVHQNMQFGAEAASASSQRGITIIGAPFSMS